MTRRRLAGIGGIVFPVLFIVAMATGGTPGGNYHADDMANFVARDHRVYVFASLLLITVSLIGLLVATNYLCETCYGEGRHGRIAWGASLLAAAALLIGLTVAVTPSTSLAIGGGPSIDPAVNYTIMQAGLGIMFVSGGIMLGVSFLTLAIRGETAPRWLRAFSGIVGVLALFSMAYFPFFAVLLWGLVVGIWLLVSSRTAEALTPQPT
jgi:hypothetical protein